MRRKGLAEAGEAYHNAGGRVSTIKEGLKSRSFRIVSLNMFIDDVDNPNATAYDTVDIETCRGRIKK